MLLSNLNGGQGLGTLGDMTLTDGNGNSVNVNLSTAATLQDVIDDINTGDRRERRTSRPRSMPPATGSNSSIRRGAPNR